MRRKERIRAEPEIRQRAEQKKKQRAKTKIRQRAEQKKRQRPETEIKQRQEQESRWNGKERQVSEIKISENKQSREDRKNQKRKQRKLLPVFREKDSDDGMTAIIYDQYHFTILEWIRYSAEGLLLGLLVVWICYRDLRALPVLLPITVLYLKLKNKSLMEKRKKTLLHHFRSFLSSFYAGLRAGYSMENSTLTAAKDMEGLYGAKDPMVKELKLIQKKIRLQFPTEQAFYDFGNRSGIEDIYHFSEVLMIAKKSGGDTGKVLQACYRTISEKIDTEKEIETMIVAQQFEQQIMSIMPILVVVYLRVSFADVMDQLYGNLTGVLIMTGALVLYCLALFWGKKIVKIEV